MDVKNATPTPSTIVDPTKPRSYRPPIEYICPSCGNKVIGWSCPRQGCQ